MFFTPPPCALPRAGEELFVIDRGQSRFYAAASLRP